MIGILIWVTILYDLARDVVGTQRVENPINATPTGKGGGADDWSALLIAHLLWSRGGSHQLGARKN